jgi:hypothetical protein
MRVHRSRRLGCTPKHTCAWLCRLSCCLWLRTAAIVDRQISLRHMPCMTIQGMSNKGAWVEPEDHQTAHNRSRTWAQSALSKNRAALPSTDQGISKHQAATRKGPCCTVTLDKGMHAAHQRACCCCTTTAATPAASRPANSH